MAQMKDKKQQLDEWFDRIGDDYVNMHGCPNPTEGVTVKKLYKMFKLGIELGYEPEENDND